MYDPWPPPGGNSWLPAPPQPARPARRGLGDLGGLVAGALVATLVAGVAVATARPPAGTTSAEVRAAQRELDRELPELVAFVERERGLRFTEPVEVRLLADTDFLNAYYGPPDDGSDDGSDDGGDGEPDDFAATLAALRLVGADADLDETAADLEAAGVLGFYDDTTDELYVRGSEITPLTRLTVVHELTHALQDQHFDLGRADRDDLDDEASLAWTALVEGDATRVETAYYEAMSGGDQRRVDQLEEEIYGDEAEAPGAEIVGTFMAFPYAAGPGLVTALLDVGGQARLDRAFATPPTTTEHVLQPGTFLSGERTARTDPPTVDGKVVDEGVLGELGLVLLLAEGTDRDLSEPVRWAGDHYRTWARGDDTCVTAAVAFDRGTDRDAFARTMRGRALGDGGSVRTTGPRSVVFTSCSG